MILLLVFLCSLVFLTAANPLAQLLLQANPSLLQNGFNNIPNQQLQFQQPNHNVNPYFLPYMVQNPVDNCPCPQKYLAQNPITRQVNKINSDDQQLNKILSNPMLQRILDPKTKLYNQNGAEIPKQTNNLPNTGVKPNIINNYFILTPECLQTMEKEETRNIKPVKVQPNNIKPRKDETQHKQRNTEDHMGTNNEKKRQRTSHNVMKQQPQNSKPKTLNPNNENSNKNHFENNNRFRNRKSNTTIRENVKRKTKKKQDHTDNTNNPVEAIEENSDIKNNEEILLNQNQNKTLENSKRRRRKKSRNHLNDSPENVNQEVILIAEELPIEQKTSKMAAQIQIKDDDLKKRKSSQKQNLKESVDTMESKDRTERNHRRRSKDEAVIRDIHTKFPGIPKDVIRDLLNYLRRQLQSQPTDNSCLQCASYQLPLRYDQLFPQFSNLNLENHNCKDSHRRRSSNRKNHNKRKKPKQVNSEEFENTETEEDTTVITDLESTTEEIINAQKEEITAMSELKNDTTKINNDKNIVQYPTTHFDIEKETIPNSTKAETTTYTSDFDKFPRLGEEDAINIFPENFVDDYYPDFRGDNIYFDNNDNNVRNLRHNRYYYTTDRNHLKAKDRKKNDASTEINYEPFKPTAVINDYKDDLKNPEKIYINKSKIIEDSLENPLESVMGMNHEVITLKPLFEELEFKTPPVLKNPDFETKPIRSDIEQPYYRPAFINNDEDKAYSAKSSTYSMAKQVDIPSKPKADNVETVFAKSKVVKYGHHEDSSKDTVGNNGSKNNDTTIVFAESLTSDEYWL